MQELFSVNQTSGLDFLGFLFLRVLLTGAGRSSNMCTAGCISLCSRYDFMREISETDSGS